MADTTEAGRSGSGRRPDLAAAVERGDLNELIALINGLCLDADWEALDQLAGRCRAAHERGRQLWPAASHADYRLALEAPGSWAAAVLLPERGRFALGPLPEVAASTHTWDELAPHLDGGPLAAAVAQERVIRGDAISPATAHVAGEAELPLSLADWEPSYPLATYGPDEAHFPAPSLRALGPAEAVPGAGVADHGVAGARPVETDDPDTCRALLDLVGAWTAASTGRARAIAVDGSAAEAAAALGVGATALARVRTDDALATMAWCAASGGAHGRRRGMAAGRFALWWTLAAMGGALEEWPLEARAGDDIAAGLSFFAFQTPEAATGWRLALAVEDLEDSISWAVWAADHAEP